MSPDALVEAGQVVAERGEQLGQDVPDPVLSWASDSPALRVGVVGTATVAGVARAFDDGLWSATRATTATR